MRRPTTNRHFPSTPLTSKLTTMFMLIILGVIMMESNYTTEAAQFTINPHPIAFHPTSSLSDHAWYLTGTLRPDSPEEHFTKDDLIRVYLDNDPTKEDHIMPQFDRMEVFLHHELTGQLLATLDLGNTTFTKNSMPAGQPLKWQEHTHSISSLINIVIKLSFVQDKLVPLMKVPVEVKFSYQIVPSGQPIVTLASMLQYFPLGKEVVVNATCSTAVEGCKSLPFTIDIGQLDHTFTQITFSSQGGYHLSHTDQSANQTPCYVNNDAVMVTTDGGLYVFEYKFYSNHTYAIRCPHTTLVPDDRYDKPDITDHKGLLANTIFTLIGSIDTDPVKMSRMHRARGLTNSERLLTNNDLDISSLSSLSSSSSSSLYDLTLSNTSSKSYTPKACSTKPINLILDKASVTLLSIGNHVGRYNDRIYSSRFPFSQKLHNIPPLKDDPIITSFIATVNFTGPSPSYFQYFITNASNYIIQQGQLEPMENSAGVPMPWFPSFIIKLCNDTSLLTNAGYNMTVTARFDKPQDFSSLIDTRYKIKTPILQTVLSLEYLSFPPNAKDEQAVVKHIGVSNFRIHKAFSGTKLENIHQIGSLMNHYNEKIPGAPQNLRVGFTIPFDERVFNPYYRNKQKLDLYLALPAHRSFFSSTHKDSTFHCRLGSQDIYAVVYHDAYGRSLPLVFTDILLKSAPSSLRCRDSTVNFNATNLDHTYYDCLQVVVVPSNNSSSVKYNQDTLGLDVLGVTDGGEYESDDFYQDNLVDDDNVIENEIQQDENFALLTSEVAQFSILSGNSTTEKPVVLIQNYPLRFARDRVWSWSFSVQVLIIATCGLLAVFLILLCICKARSNVKKQRKESTSQNLGVNSLSYDRME